jgi:VWFA-related protein
MKKYPMAMKKTLAVFALFTLCFTLTGWAQGSQQQTQSQSGNQSQTQSSQQPQSQTQQVPAAGGPQGDIGPMAIPKKKEEAPPPPKAQPKPQNLPEFSLSVNTQLVQVPVSVVTKQGQFIPGLKKDNFKVFEDGVQQNVSNFSQQEAPITAVLLVEFASTYYKFMYDALNASYAFAQQLKPQDWVAVVSYDMKPHMILDFTQDKNAVLGAINSLRIPGFSEMNMFDALYDTIDRLEQIEGRKYIILVGTGLDTFSKLTYDKMLKKVQSTRDITIFTVSTGWYLRERMDIAYGGRGWGGADMMNFQQADNEMKTFSKMTGGQFFQPRFEAEMPQIFQAVNATIRSQYVLAYHPSNTKQDGSFRKIKVELTGGPDGGPPKIVDEKGKTLKVTVMAREGYTAKHEVE